MHGPCRKHRPCQYDEQPSERTVSGRLQPGGRAGMLHCPVAASFVCRTPAQLLGAGQGRARPKVGARATSTLLPHQAVVVVVALTSMAVVGGGEVEEVASTGRPVMGQPTIDLVKVVQRWGWGQAGLADDGNNPHTLGSTVKTCRLFHLCLLKSCKRIKHAGVTEHHRLATRNQEGLEKKKFRPLLTWQTHQVPPTNLGIGNTIVPTPCARLGGWIELSRKLCPAWP